jgi:hypothetical protein
MVSVPWDRLLWSFARCLLLRTRIRKPSLSSLSLESVVPLPSVSNNSKASRISGSCPQFLSAFQRCWRRNILFRNILLFLSRFFSRLRDRWQHILHLFFALSTGQRGKSLGVSIRVQPRCCGIAWDSGQRNFNAAFSRDRRSQPDCHCLSSAGQL